MKKLILLFALITNIIFAEGFGNVTQPTFTKPEDAFKVSFVDRNGTQDSSVYITLANDIYIYQDSLKFKTAKEEIKPQLPTAQKFHDEMVYMNKLEIVIPTDMTNGASELEVAFEGCSKAGMCYAPISKKFPLTSSKSESIGEKLSALANSTNTQDIANAITKESFGFVILLFFIGGLLMALTPCIFPMVPILSTILVAQSKNSKPSMASTFFTSLVYVLSMAVAYSIIGVIAGLVGFDMIAAMQNPWVLIAFALMFIALAFSLFGYYELGLPASWQTKLSKMSDNAQGKGIIGTAIMGLLSALIVGPCVAPILAGAVIFITKTGDALLGGVALFVMTIGMGVPLLIIGLGAGKWMPRPGGWMNIVSKFFGVVMIILAIMMLSRISFDDANRYSVEKLQAEIDTSSQPVIIDFTKEACAACKELEHITFPNPAVKEAMKSYKFITVDVSDNSDDDRKLMAHYGVFGTPNILFIDKNKKFRSDKTITGFIAPDKFVTHIKSLESK